jgi:hypothetical protein
MEVRALALGPVDVLPLDEARSSVRLDHRPWVPRGLSLPRHDDESYGSCALPRESVFLTSMYLATARALSLGT